MRGKRRLELWAVNKTKLNYRVMNEGWLSFLPESGVITIYFYKTPLTKLFQLLKNVTADI